MTVAVEPRYSLADVAAILRGEMRDRSYLLTPLGPHVDDCLAYLRVEKGRADRTLDSYERHLSRMCHVLADKLTLAEITRDDLRGVLNTYERTPKHRKVCWAAMRTFWKFLYHEDRVVLNPMDKVDSPSFPRIKPKDLFSPEEEARIVNQTWIRDRVGCLMLLRAGLRNSEVRNVRRCDVDLYAKTINVPVGKGNKPRVVPVAGELATALDEFLMSPVPTVPGYQPSASDYVLYVVGSNRHAAVTWARPGRPMSLTAFNRWWHRMLTVAEVRYRHPHIARHTCLTRLDELGVRASVIQSIAGHSSIQTTFDYYVHTSERDAAEAIGLRERSIRGKV